MDISTKLTAIVTLVLALSIASERLVEILKGFFPWLDQKSSDSTAEGWRRAILQILAVVSGVLTAWLASGYLPTEIVKPDEVWKIIGLGLLASGGSGFWNSILDYFTGLKDIKNAEAKKARAPSSNAAANNALGAAQTAAAGE
jgi:hypothetical protein